jgi:hypothetical protein
VDLQIEKEKLKEYAKKVKGVLWLLGTTFAAFWLYVIMLAVMFGLAVNPESPDDLHTVSFAVVFGGIIIPLLLPMAMLYWRKIRIGKTATTVFTVLCAISLTGDFLFAGLACLLRLLAGLFPHTGLFADFVFETAGLLVLGIFARTSLLISLLTISENSRRTIRFILLGISGLEIALLALFIFNGLGL